MFWRALGKHQQEQARSRATLGASFSCLHALTTPRFTNLPLLARSSEATPRRLGPQTGVAHDGQHQHPTDWQVASTARLPTSTRIPAWDPWKPFAFGARSCSRPIVVQQKSGEEKLQKAQHVGEQGSADIGQRENWSMQRQGMDRYPAV
jgi:hypothetical protein